VRIQEHDSFPAEYQGRSPTSLQVNVSLKRVRYNLRAMDGRKIKGSLENRGPRSSSLRPVCHQPILRLSGSFCGFHFYCW
jgi:hypothetical protein